MRNLATLVRLHNWRIEESTRKLADLDAVAVQFRRRISDIGDRLAAEAPLAGVSVETAISYSNFMRAENERRATLARSLADLEHEITQAREHLADAFRELKSYEITLDRKRKHAARIEGRREQSILDEIGQTMHRARTTQGFA